MLWVAYIDTVRGPLSGPTFLQYTRLQRDLGSQNTSVRVGRSFLDPKIFLTRRYSAIYGSCNRDVASVRVGRLF